MALVSLTDYVSSEMMQEIADNFYEATHMVVGFSDYQGNLLSKIDHFSTPICNYYRSAPQFANCCITCDAVAGMLASITRKPYTHICHSGLCYCALPIYLESTYLGIALIGEVRVSEEEKKLLPSMQDMTHTQYPTPEFYQKAYEGVRLVTLDELDSHAKLLNLLLRYIIEVGDKKIRQDKFLEQQNELLKKKEIETELKLTINKLKLQTLSNRMRPEFLWAAFDSIYQQAVIEGADGTVNMLRDLNRLLKKESDQEESLITVKKELEYTENMVRVFGFARDQEILFESDITSGLEETFVPGRMISNLVEQFFLSKESEAERIVIRASVSNAGKYMDVILSSPQISPASVYVDGERGEFPEKLSKEAEMMHRTMINVLSLIYQNDFWLKTEKRTGEPNVLHMQVPLIINHK